MNDEFILRFKFKFDSETKRAVDIETFPLSYRNVVENHIPKMDSRGFVCTKGV